MKTSRPINRNYLPTNFQHGVQPMQLQVLHDTGNYLKGDTAIANRTYWEGQNNGVSAHGIIDKIQILETLPFNQKGWHVGGAGNVNSWGVELCNMTTQADFDSQIDDCARYFAQVRLDHMAGVAVTKDNLKSHHECNLTMQTGSDHTDPTNYLAHYGFSMDKFRALVQTYLNQLKNPVATPVASPVASLVYPTDLPLQVGSQGASVVKMQKFLGILADGDFGNGTKGAVIKYQTMRGLSADGVVGKITWSNMFSGMK